MNALIALAAFVAIALVGYQNNEEEEAALERTQEAQKKADYGEMDIHDVMETISTKGFKAV